LGGSGGIKMVYFRFNNEAHVWYTWKLTSRTNLNLILWPSICILLFLSNCELKTKTVNYSEQPVFQVFLDSSICRFASQRPNIVEGKMWKTQPNSQTCRIRQSSSLEINAPAKRAEQVHV
jgi:hypothetical protein